MKKLLVIGTILLLLLGFSGQGMAGKRIGINIPLPPVFVFSAPPELVVIPGTNAYYCPDVNFDIFFYGGYWYRSASYGGPWVYIESAPSVFLSLPPNYRIIVRGERRIPYVEMHRNWRAWERERYWEHHNWGRSEHMRHYGLSPSFREREHRDFGGRVHGGGGFHRGDRQWDHERR